MAYRQDASARLHKRQNATALESAALTDVSGACIASRASMATAGRTSIALLSCRRCTPRDDMEDTA